MASRRPSTSQPRYITWRYADRHFSKVHVLGPEGISLCGRTPGREVGRPTPPFPEGEQCPECSSATEDSR